MLSKNRRAFPDMMKTIIIILFCLVSGLSLGAIAGTSMSMAFEIDLPAGPYIGAIFGGVLGLLFSPLFILRRANRNIFAILVLCFSLSFPVSLISGLTRNSWLAAGLTMVAMLSTYYLSTRDGSADEKDLFSRKQIYIIPFLCVMVASIVAYNYEDKSLPIDIPALIEMMGDNDISRHMAAARKLKTYGKAPFLIAIKHENPNVRAVAAHFLGLLKDPSVQDVLIEASKDPDPYVRMWTAFSLGQIGDTKALPALRSLAKDSKRIVQSEAEEAINKIQKRSK